ncbi:AAA family ATPase [Streptomyces niveiscabiei]|uniref:MgsA AAA+ ATPase C-terminal domain-containing protein n=1 Tax=Streptomyces niveiscabiei TaxID=164115 RepID=A0ABW9HGK8_9ACTN
MGPARLRQDHPRPHPLLADTEPLDVTALPAWQVYERLGSPEGELARAQDVVHLATAPKPISVYRPFGAVQQTSPTRAGS